ncbi:NAD(P)/FAD-dependent oxidoreductase [Mycobacterium sp. NAZ190054]|uniref:flavin-containing monooxygenase n=1 Tax=Mycobacterium sp. NAZ190054 TaxID=1747766 RepID=UPI0009E99C3F|nr:NAD(P)/FAD-dependent oxidoreductase [Mycobacterium sp. NAZ190054]
MAQWKQINASDEFIREALAQADPIVLRVILHQLGDSAADDVELVTVPGPLIGTMSMVADPSTIARLQDRMLHHLRRSRDEGFEFPGFPSSRSELHRLVEMAICAPVSDRDLDFWIEEAAIRPMQREVDWGTVPSEAREQFSVVIIGAGMSGLNVAIQLKRAGIPFVILEKNASVGGTWFANTYPGIRVDVPSRVYSYSFEFDYPWKHMFAPQSELHAFIEHVVDKYDLRGHIRFETEVRAAEWDDEDQVWVVRTTTASGSSEVLRANGLVSAVGLLDRPRMPEIEGIETFAGPKIHTANWDHSVELSGLRVASIGTGSSGLQLVPDLAPLVEHLTVFQRTPAWVVGFPGYRDPLPEHAAWLDSTVPYYANWSRLRLAYAFGDHLAPYYEIDAAWQGDGPDVSEVNAQLVARLRGYIREKLDGREDLIKKCTPEYAPLAKRLVLDNGWFDALLRDDVELVTEPIARISEKGIVLQSGEELEFDAIVFASGFRANDYLYPIEVRGRGGLPLTEFWKKDGARAYLGMMMPNFPNLWCMYGPNTNPKSGNPIQLSEVATRYVVGCIKAMIEEDLSSVEIREDVFDKFQEALDAALSQAIWSDPRQKSYYRNEFDRIAVMSPWPALDYWRWTTEPQLNEFVVTPK